MTWLVTGGAGYIGAHVASALHDAGVPVVVLDDLSTGSVDRIPATAPRVVGSVLDSKLVRTVLREYQVDGIIHTAGKKLVSESVRAPLFYYHENLEGLRGLLDAAGKEKVRKFVFSSSAAVYGSPDVDCVTEKTPCHPVSPYGETKLGGEWLIRAVANSTGMGYAILRYFNVAGAGMPELVDRQATNLIPMVLDQLERGRQPIIFGTDYPTPDGTCVRDFIHVSDLATAHLATARRLTADPGTQLTLNIGRSRGVSVRQIITIVSEITGYQIEPRILQRRRGDPPQVVASIDAIIAELGWSPRLGVREMVASAWTGRLSGLDSADRAASSATR